MAIVDAGKQETILHYLSVEGLSASAIKSLRGDIVTYLVSNGHTVNKTKGCVLKTDGATSAWLRNKLNKQSNKQIKARFYAGVAGEGLIDESQLNHYGKKIQIRKDGPKMGESTKTSAAGNTLPKRTIRADKYDYNSMMDANLLNIATNGQPTAQWLKAAHEVAAANKTATKAFNLKPATYKYKVGAGLGGTPAQDVTEEKDKDEEEGDDEDIDDLFEDDDEEITEEVIEDTPEEKPSKSKPTPAEPKEASEGTLKDPQSYDKAMFPPIVPPTEEEEISLSGKEWDVIKENSEGYYPYHGTFYMELEAAPGETAWQPYTSTIVGSGEMEDEELDDLFDDEDLEDLSVDEADTTPYFTTPNCVFSFQAGMKAVFHIKGDTSKMWYAGAGQPAGKGQTNHFMVDTIELQWAKPQAGITDSVIGCRIIGHNSSAKSEGHTILVEPSDQSLVTAIPEVVLTDGGNTNNGFHYNISVKSDDGEVSNLYGGANKGVTNNSILVYGHGVAGFGGLQDSIATTAPEDTMVWSDLNDGGVAGDGAYASGSVKIDPDKSIAQVIQTQVSRFYGNENITDKTAYWSNWLPGGSGNMNPINGGDNVIMYFSPMIELRADIKDYVDTEYLRPKRKKLDITVKEGQIPESTDIVGVISYTEVLDEDGDVEDEIWDSYVELNVIPAAGSSTDYYTGRDTTSKDEINVEKIMLPGDESKLRFKVPPYGEKDIINVTGDGLARANSISYITYDKSTVEYLNKDDEGNPLADSAILVPQIKVFFRDGTSLIIPDEEGEFRALDFNDEELEGEVEGAELKPPQPKVVIRFGDNTDAYEKIEKQRRNKNLAPSHTKRNDDGDVVTQNIAIKIGSKYFVIGTVKGKSVLLMVDLHME